MKSDFRECLFRLSLDPSDENMQNAVHKMARVHARSDAGAAWIREHEGIPAGRRSFWAARGLRLWDMGELEERKAAATRPVCKSEMRTWRDLWETPVSSLAGCGQATQSALHEAGIQTLADLIFLLPRQYLDLRTITPVAAAVEKQAQLFFVTVDRVSRAGRKCFAQVHDDTGVLHLLWFFTVPMLFSMLRPGARLYVTGEPHVHGGRCQLVHPRVHEKPPSGIHVIHPTIAGVKEGVLQRLLDQVLQWIPQEPTLPPEVERDEGLWPLSEALRFLHRPQLDIAPEELQALSDGTHPAHKRLLFEEVFQLQCAIGMQAGLGRGGAACRVLEDRIGEYARAFPFSLTDAQLRVTREIVADMTAGRPMRRLLQGDVGSGKTAVAFLCAAHVMGIGRQAAVMAPTALLAEQLHRSFSQWCAHFGWQCALLTADTPAAARESILALLEAGKIQVLVGTHSLLQERIAFADLGLVVVDEQHRFGVEQRARLAGKGSVDERPHLLVMSATPIPRSLALTVYGDLENSRLEGRPPGRPEVVTVACFTKEQKRRALARFMKNVSQSKGFVIVPLIDESAERVSIDTAVSYLSRQYPDVRLGVVHGRMPARERQDVLSDFAAGTIRVLVATTVVEVGMDVPDANYMVILEADRFGLAQLHQLRGRIGRRSAETAECLLFAGASPTPEGRERLRWMERTNDGFALAEADLSMRGPGDVLGGRRQAGAFKPAWIRNVELLQTARVQARTLLEADPQLERHPELAFWVNVRFRDRVFDESGG